MPHPLWIGIALLGIAWALRLPFLSFHSMWLDEAMAVWVARLPLPTMVERTMAFKEEVSPPLYFLLVKGWAALVGEGEFTLRFFSTWWIVLGLAWLGHVGAFFAGRSVRPILLALGASQPYLIWFSQEARVYGLLFALSAMSTVWLLKALRTDRPRAWWLYAFTMAAAYYTHLTAVWISLAHGVMAWVAGHPLWRTRGGRGALGLLILAGLPLAWLAWSGQREAVLWWNPPLPPLEALKWILSAWTVDPNAAAPLAISGALYALILLAAAAWRAPRFRAGLAGLAVGLVAWYLASRHFPLTSSRYGMSLTPLVLAGLAVGINHRPWRAWALAGWVGLAAVGFQHLWSPLNAKEDWRGAARWVAAHAGSHDVALFFAEYVRFPFFYYYRKPLNHSAFAHPIPDQQAAEEVLSRIPLENGETLWYIRAHADWADPLDRIDQALRARYPLRMQVFPEKIRIRAYALQWTRPALPPEARPVGHRFAAGWTLEGFHHAATDGLSPRRWGVFPPTRHLHLTLYWRRLPDAHPEARLQVFLAQVGGDLRIEGVPLPGGLLERHPPRTWSAGPLVVDDRDFFLEAQTPPGAYMLLAVVSAPTGPVESLALDTVWVR